jgi:hypothetical protein
MNEAPVLRECPFCGSYDTFLRYDHAQIPARMEAGHSRMSVACVGCGARGPWQENVDCGPVVAVIRDLWNTRKPEDAARKAAH